jgi:tetratricopeptide (TPR) repeat protein
MRGTMAVVVCMLFVWSGAVFAAEDTEGQRLMKQVAQELREGKLDDALKTAELALATNRKELAAATAAKDTREANAACIRVALSQLMRGAVAQVKSDSWDETDRLFAEASAEVDRYFKDPKELAGARMAVLSMIVYTYLQQEQYARAEPYVRRVIEATELVSGRNSVSYAGAAMQLGDILYLQDKPVDADPWLTTALGIYDKAPEAKPNNLAHTLLMLGMVKMDRKQFAQAEGLLLKATAELEALGDRQGIASAEVGLAQVLDAQGKKVEAEKHKQRGLAIQEELKKAE